MARTTPTTTEARGMGPLPRLVIEGGSERQLLSLLFAVYGSGLLVYLLRDRFFSPRTG